MDIVSAQTHRVLLYMDALNSQGVAPPARQVNEFGSDPDLRSRTVPGLKALSSAAALSMTAMFADRTEQEDYADYLLRLGWVRRNQGGLTLTRTGKALVRALRLSSSQAEDDLDVVLDADDPFAYSRVLDRLASMGGALLVDPYVRVDQLVPLMRIGTITRILIGSQVSVADREVLATVVTAAGKPDREVEMRIATKLHDRYVIPDEESEPVRMLGVSMNGIGKHTSVLTTLGERASTAIRDTFTTVWSEGEMLIHDKGSADDPEDSDHDLIDGVGQP